MGDLLSSAFVILGWALLLGWVSRSFERRERAWLWLTLAAHAGAAFAQVLIVHRLYGGGDIDGYFRFGQLLSSMLKEDPVEVSGLLLQLVFHQESVPLPMSVLGGSTGAMLGISGFVVLLGSDSLVASCMVLSAFSFFGRLALYRVFRRELSRNTWGLLYIACLMVPSVVFWTSGLLKEAVAMGGLGLAVYGGHSLATRRAPLIGLVGLAFGLTATAVVKPYLVIPFGIATGLWIYLDGHRPPERRRFRSIRAAGAIAGTLVATLVLVGVGKFFPQFDVSTLADQAAHMQQLVELTDGGSDYQIGSAEARTLAGQVALVPVALATALFRPTPLEVTSPQLAATAAETLPLALLLAWGLLRNGLRRAWLRLRRNPMLGFSGVLVLGIAVGVGLGTTNLGSLSRYRAPMVPFYVAIIFVLAQPERRDEEPQVV